MIFVSLRSVSLGNKFVASKTQHCLKHSLVANATAAHIAINHPLPQIRE